MTLKPATFRLETEILAALEAIRERDGITVSEQVRRALKQWIAEKGVKADRKRVSPRSRS
jgi:antitoxin component of RelBE/YafQ-DinJ toxin-antitoxin module